MVRFYGDWDKVNKTFKDLRRANISKEYGPIMHELGTAIADKLRNHIMRQDLHWEPLSPVTIAKKGGSEIIYIETKAFLKSIHYKVVRKNKSTMQLSVNVKGKHPGKKKNKIEMQTLASYLEYGTKFMPARPLWRPVFKNIPSMQEFKDILDKGFRLK